MKYIVPLLFLIYNLFAQAPNLLLLKTYDSSMDVTGWLMSEKLDGVRAYWDGKKLISRGGRVFDAPIWFTKGFPPFSIDGELWTSRSNFEQIVSIVNTRKPHDGWQVITYNVFEVPKAKGGLLQRLQKLENYLEDHPNRYLKIISQIKINHRDNLKDFFDAIIEGGGEGAVLRNPDALYYAGRDRRSLKYKGFDDDECEVVGYLPGKGKFKGLVGALQCKWNDQIVKIGSGLKNVDRTAPPTIGTQITFKYYGLTKKGKPKYPVFIRVRN